MTAGQKLGLIILGIFLGGAVGCGLGLAGGLAWTTLASTSGFEGYSGFVVAFWMLGGIIAGAIAGPFLALRFAAKKA